MFHSKNSFVRKKRIIPGNCPGHPIPSCLEKVDVLIPAEGILHDHCYLFKGKGVWKYWPETLRSLKCEETSWLQETLVPTVDTAKYEHVMLKSDDYKSSFQTSE